jgi:hypothetical protein
LELFLEWDWGQRSGVVLKHCILLRRESKTAARNMK